MHARELVDIDRCPIDRTNSAAYQRLLRDVRGQLLNDGCAVIKEFLRSDVIAKFVNEADRVAAAAHRSFNSTNAYFTADDKTLSAAHPVRRFYGRSNAFVPADNFAAQGPLRTVYEWQPVMNFIQDCLQEERFYRYADPLADVIINLTEEGDGFPWHFDTNNYTVTLALQNGDEGGIFEYVPNLRSPDRENYAGVRAVLDGDRSDVRQLELNPGDLQIFKGRYSLHRVTPVSGETPRYVGIYSFVDQPNMVARVERAKQLYGRALPVHYEAAKRGIRSDTLLD